MILRCRFRDYLHHSGGLPSITVRTCSEWAGAKLKGYYTPTTCDIKMETVFKHTYSVLTALKISTPVIRPEWLSHSNVEKLPLDILPYLESTTEHQQYLKPFKDRGFSLVDLEKLGIIKMSKEGDSCLTIEDEGSVLYLRELLVADLNEDGLPELLVGAYMRVIGGTFGGGYILILGQGPSGEIVMLDDSILLPQDLA